MGHNESPCYHRGTAGPADKERETCGTMNLHATIEEQQGLQTRREKHVAQ